MNVDHFTKTISAAIKERDLFKVIAVIEAVTIVLCLVVLGGKKVIVEQVPSNLTKPIMSSKSGGDRAYKETWALGLAEMIGNISPGNAKFVMNAIQGYFSPAMYTQIQAAIQTQVGELEDQQASISFRPKNIVFEPSTGHVFVTGDQAVHAAGVPAKLSAWTMEFGIDVVNYAPVVNYYDAYASTPRTENVRKELRTQEGAKLRAKKSNGGSQ